MTSAAKKLDRVRDRAGFTPIPPNLDINELVKSCRNFHHVSRADARTFNSAERLKEMIQSQVIDGGKPLVLENWHETPDWPKWIFKPEWLVDNHGQDPINIRDISSMEDHSFSMKHYLNSLSVLASKFTAQDYDGTKQRLYAKDIDCPPAWQKSLEKILPACTFYLSPADLMSHLPIDARAENLMCYFGHEGTYTPAHKEMCASLGQNIMVYTSPGGSSLWFMTASEDRDVVAEYWLGGLGHDIEVESHFASIEALKNAPFPVYIVEQKVGDFILVPPLAPHQVWNCGEATMKVAWNRTTAETLKLAIEESLPKARLVCRDEQYKNKAIIYETLKHYHRILSREISRDHDISLSKLKADFCMLFELFDTIMLDEHFSPVYEGRVEVKKIPNEFNVTCSFCRGNIFNRFLSCKRCVEPSDDEGGDDDVYDICMECYARGRSCACISKLCWEEQHDWNTLLRDHEKFRMQVISIEGAVTEDSPRKLATAFKNIEKKSLAWVCQEQLLARPFVDVTKDPSLDDVDDAKDIERKKRMGLLVNCHVCKVRHPDWKIAKCNACSKAYCYGNLWRAFDIDPFEVLCDAEWKCPFCLGICSCGQCRKNGKMVPYEPKGTMLGASTKHVADPRSVESLVDFSRGNLTWLSENIESLKRKRSSVGTDDGDAIARSFTSFDEYGTIDEEDEGYGLQHNGEIPIDPSLVVSSDEAPKARDDDYHEPDLDGSVRNGQYIANYPSSVLVERGSYHQADGKASAVASATKSIRTPGARERRGNPLDKQPLLPSPKDMLTGALPLRRREALPHDTILSHPSSYYSSEARNMFDKPQSKDLKDDIQPYTHQSLSRIDADNQSMWPEMSSLERNPEAFIAAAGLSILSGIESYPGELSSSSEAIGSHLLGVSSSWPAASTITATGLPEDLTCYAGGILHSPQTTRGRDRDEAENTANPLPDDTYNPIAPIMLAKAKRRSNPYGISAATSEIIGVNGTFPMSEPTQSMYELMANDQAKKQKRARYIASKGKGRNKKTLVVKLKLGVEGWQKWEEKAIEPDMITEYYMKGGRLHKVTARRDDIGVGSADGSKRQRGRPRKSAPTVSETNSDQEKDDEDDNEDEDEDEEEEEMEVIPEPKSRRRESAWIARKREEEAAEAAEKAIKDAKFAQEKATEDAQQRIIDERQRIMNEKRAAEEEKIRKEIERLQAIEDEKEERRRAYQEAKVLAAEVAEGMLEDTRGVDSDGDNLRMDEDEDIPQERGAFWESQLPGSSFAVVIEKRPGIYWRSQYATEAEPSLKAGLAPWNATKTAQPVSIPTTAVPTARDSILPTPQTKINTTRNPALKIWKVERLVPVNRATPKSPAPADLVRKSNLPPKVNIAAKAPIPKPLDRETASSSSKWQPPIQRTSTELEKNMPTTELLKDKWSIIKDESSGLEWGGDDEAWGGNSVNMAKKWMY